MAAEDVNARMVDNSQRAQQERLLRSRMTSSAEIAGQILDPRLKDVKYAIPAVVEFVMPAALDCHSISTYESQPIASALLLKAMGGQVETIRAMQVGELDLGISDELKSPILQGVLGKYEDFESGIDKIPPLLDEDEDVVLMKYNDLVGQRAWVLEQMTDGLAPLCEQEMNLRMRITRVEIRRETVNGDFEDLSAEEISEYRTLITKQLGNLNKEELGDYQRLRTKSGKSPEDEALWSRLVGKVDSDLDGEEQIKFKTLVDKTHHASLEDLTLFETAGTTLSDLTSRQENLREQIDKKMSNLKNIDPDWMRFYKAFNGMVSNVNVTDAWRKAWHDLGAGAVDGFTQTRWAEYQKPSELVALMELSGVGEAMQIAFKAMCKIGLNKPGEVSPNAVNILQKDKMTDVDVKNGFIDPVKEYVIRETGGKVPELYVGFGVEMARMLMENSFVAGWLCAARDKDGNILYKWNENDNKNGNSSLTSEAYKYGVIWSGGDGSTYPDRQNDYIKIAAPRAKQLNEFANTYETGLPALVPVLPDSFSGPWIAHDDLLKLANGDVNLVDVFKGKAENNRWSWAYGVFRQAQVYDMVSKFVVGLKGFRGVADEVMFFLQSPSNLGGLSKKIDVAFGFDDNGVKEAQRLKMNFALALLYAVDTRRANPNWDNEKKTILANRGSNSGGIEENIIQLLIQDKKDDIGRMFVGRAGFVTSGQWNEIWSRFKQVDVDQSKSGIGMIKRSENLKSYVIGEDSIKKAKLKRRKDLVGQV